MGVEGGGASVPRGGGSRGGREGGGGEGEGEGEGGGKGAEDENVLIRDDAGNSGGGRCASVQIIFMLFDFLNFYFG